MLTADQFRRDLMYVYSELNPRQLNGNYLNQLLGLFSEIYATHLATFFNSPDTDRDDAEASYQLILTTLATALTDFTKHVDPMLLASSVEPLFQTTRPTASMFIDTSNKESPLLPGFEKALCALVRPFKDEAFRRFISRFIYDWTSSPVAPQLDQYVDQKEFERDKRAFFKIVEQAWARSTDLKRILVNTILFPWVGKLKPPESVTVPLDIPHDKWFEGCWIIAPPGRGKTNLLRHLLLHHLEEQCSIITMDAKGELIESFNRLDCLKDRLVFLEPDLEHPLAINPLDIGAHSVELLEYIFAALLESQMTPLQSTLFRAILDLLSRVPGATLETFRQVLNIQKNDELKPWTQYIDTLYPEDQDFFYKEMNSKTYASTKQEVLWRLRLLNGNPYIRAMFRNPTTRVDMGALMDAGKVICINNNYDILGDQGSEFFARFFIALVWNAARKRSRSRDRKTPVYFFIDEAHYAIARDRTISTILNQCRAQKISMIFAHQELQQIKDDDVKAALSNCAIKFANSTGEANELASRFETTPEFLKSQKRGQFAVYVRDLTDTAVSVPVRLVDMSSYETMTEQEFREIRAQGHARYCSTEGSPRRSGERPREEPRPRAEEPPQPDAPDTPPDLHWTITVSPKIAEKGGQHRIQAKNDAHQPVTLKIAIPPGTQDGEVLRVKGYGAFNGTGERGHLYLTIRVPPKPASGKAQTPPGNLELDPPQSDDEERW